MAKAGRSLQELAAEIERQAKAKRDYIAPAAALSMAVAEGGNGVRLDVKDVGALPVNGLAHGQLAEYTEIPKGYYDRMLTGAPALLAANVNQWLAGKNGDRRMVRTLDGNVRAFLSDKYRSLENYDLAEAILPPIIDQDLFVVSCEITERRLYIKAFDRRIEREIKAKGSDPAHTFLTDVVYPAITISNSETGYGALSVAAGLYTGGCTNFASFHDSRMRKYHTGARAALNDGTYELLSDETKRLTDQAIWHQTRDVVKSAFEIARFEELVKRVSETADQKITGDVVKVVEVTSQHFGLTKTEGSSVLKHLIEGGNLSRYGLFNAITRTAEDLPDYDRATEFERIGGRVIELPRHDWETLAKAA